MRVCYITHVSNLYGANRSLLDMMDGLSDRGVHSHVICPQRGEFTAQLEQRKIPYLIQPISWWVDKKPTVWTAFKRLGSNIKLTPKIIQQLRQWQIDLVHSNASVTPIGSWTAKLYGCPHIWHLREFCDLDYKLYWDWGERISHSLISRSDKVIANSNATLQHHYKNPDLLNHEVIYNGIAAAEEFESRRNLSTPDKASTETFSFLIIGYLNHNKGQHKAIEALARLSIHANVCLHIAGDGDESYMQYCQSRVRQLGLENKVHFSGYIADPKQAFKRADAVLMCSQHEAMGRVTIEAMSMAKPVIGYDQGGTSELIQHGQTGLLYSGAEQQLADCMGRLINDQNLAKQLGQNAWLWSRAHFSNEYFTRQVHAVYCELLQYEA